MFWKTHEPHGLPHNPFKSCVVPRPIGWISTLDADGLANLGPYSFFNGVAGDPPMVMFASGGRKDGQKDSISNAEATGEFVCSMVSWELKDQMNTSSANVGADVDEFQLAGLETEPSELVAPPRVKAAPIHLECTYFQTVELPPDPRSGGGNAICIGRVIGVYIADAVMKDGMVDTKAFRPVARLGYMDYTSVTEVFEILRPD